MRSARSRSRSPKGTWPMSEYVYADMVPTGATCPELRMRVDDIEAAFVRIRKALEAGHLEVAAFELDEFMTAAVRAIAQASIEVNALHDTANGAF